MPYELPFKSSDQVIELGGGTQAVFHPNVDIREGPGVDVVADLSKPIPVKSESYDSVFSKYALEHLSWRVMPGLVKEAFRIVKPGGTTVFVVPNTKAQMEWALRQDDEDYSKVAQCLMGDLDYPENSHKAAFSPAYAIKIFREAGFTDVAVIPYGEIGTDMVIEARKSEVASILPELKKLVMDNDPSTWTSVEREQAYDRHYFNGGSKFGGYAREGYWDYPCHWTTLKKILEEKPESVLELGCARGYVLKRLQDSGIRAEGLEVSRHCLLTRVCNGITQWDLTKVPWPFKDKEFDLAFSAATLEHIPESSVDAVAREIDRVSKRGLHGIDLGEHDDGFDKTHCSLKPISWWTERLGPSQKIVDKEDLEAGPVQLPKDGSMMKLNCGSWKTMFHHGWTNIDIHPLQQHASQYGYIFEQMDLRNGFPWKAWKADMVYASHFIEHLTYVEGRKFLKDCLEIIKPGGLIRLAIPDARKLATFYVHDKLGDLDEMNDGAASSPDQAMKFWELLFSGHSAAYDAGSLASLLTDIGFKDVKVRAFRESASSQMLTETLDLFPEISSFVEGVR